MRVAIFEQMHNNAFEGDALTRAPLTQSVSRLQTDERLSLYTESESEMTDGKGGEDRAGSGGAVVRGACEVPVVVCRL